MDWPATVDALDLDGVDRDAVATDRIAYRDLDDDGVHEAVVGLRLGDFSISGALVFRAGPEGPLLVQPFIDPRSSVLVSRDAIEVITQLHGPGDPPFGGSASTWARYRLRDGVLVEEERSTNANPAALERFLTAFAETVGTTPDGTRAYLDDAAPPDALQPWLDEMSAQRSVRLVAFTLAPDGPNSLDPGDEIEALVDLQSVEELADGTTQTVYWRGPMTFAFDADRGQWEILAAAVDRLR